MGSRQATQARLRHSLISLLGVPPVRGVSYSPPPFILALRDLSFPSKPNDQMPVYGKRSPLAWPSVLS